MTGYYEPVPAGKIFGAALKVTNTSETDVTGIYADAGIFLHFSDDTDYPLMTFGADGVTTIPANSTIYIEAKFPEPFVAWTNCQLRVDSTSIPSDCILTPVLLIGADDLA